MRDIYFSVFLSAILLGVIFAYLVRLLLRGPARFARLESHGGSVFLHKSAMEMGYWLLDPIAGGLIALRVTPNMVTAFSSLPGLAAGVAAAFGWFGLACALGTMSALCDIMDGEMARRTGLSSDAGEIVDAAIDRYTESFLIGGLAFYYRSQETVLLLAMAALVGSFMVSYTTAKAEAAHVPPPRGSMRRAERGVYLLVASGLTGFTKVLFADSASQVLREIPILAAIALVGIVSNASAVRRFTILVHALRARG